MEFLTILFIALGLSVDSFAVSVTCGITLPAIRFRQAVPFAITLALFQGGMPVLGWFAGSGLSGMIGDYDHWIALLLLVFVGGRMILESIRKINGRPAGYNPLRWNVALILALATSIDALVVGFSMGLVHFGIWGAAALIAAVTFLASMTGMLFGKRSGLRFGRRLEILGGIILILIGIKIFIEHQFLAA